MSVITMSAFSFTCGRALYATPSPAAFIIGISTPPSPTAMVSFGWIFSFLQRS